MFKKLVEYNWKLFRHSLTAAKLMVLIVYGLLLFLIFSQVISTIYAIIMLQNPQLNSMFRWYTPERGKAILLGFVNLLWLAQFFFTNIRLMKLEENRKLLTFGFPLGKLARYLSLLAFFHPLNLLFNISWFTLLMLQFGNAHYIPLALTIVLANFSIIYSAKFRVLKAIKNYQKWLLLLILFSLPIMGVLIQQLLSNSFFERFQQYLGSFNYIATLLPGGLVTIAPTLLHGLSIKIAVSVFCLGISFVLFWDHLINTRKALQSAPAEENHELKSSRFQDWLCTQFGSHAGKYVYYVATHPYNKIQAIIFLGFPIIYIPFMISRIDELGASKFIILFFFMYAPMGFQLMFLGNMFGYEHRELLKEMQFPVLLDKQLKQRIQGAFILPLTMLVIVSGTEVILLMGKENLLSILLGNIIIFEVFSGLYLWSSFYRLKKVQWVSFSFSQPVIARSVQFTSGFLMMALSAALYISFGSFEIY
ncbi:MAG TPA: hypothetical protein VJ964_12125, partial [Balneolaceae bacterium]|nr:hypothetical protein [Balneolaceae bacterium]